MVGYSEYMGGFFHGLGGAGMLNVIAGALTVAGVHGFVAGKVAKYLAEKKGTDSADEYNKADVMTTAIMAVPIGVFGALRVTKYDYESDVLDFIGNMLGGGMVYESGNIFEVATSLLKEI